MALVITVILLAVVTFMAVAFLTVSRRERGAVTTTTDTVTAQLAAADALSAAEAQIMANTLATTNPYNFGLLVSTNYINLYGFNSAVSGYNPTNVNYDYYYSATGPKPGPLSVADYLRNLANLYYLPRPPVFYQTNDDSKYPLDFRFYLDLNRNGQFDTNGVVTNFVPDAFGVVKTDGTSSSQVGDPEWIGVLQHPAQPYGPNNPFVARYAFIAVPIGNALDLNHIFNQALDMNATHATATTVGVNPSPDGSGKDNFFRNQGVGPWEINLAAFLADLNTNKWGLFVGSGNSSPVGSASYYQYDQPANPNLGSAFDDARALLAYRYADNYQTLLPADALFPDQNANSPVFDTFPYDNIDEYSDGPLQTGPGPIDEALNPDDPAWAWAGSPNTNHFFSIQDLFDPNKVNIGAASALNSFTNRLLVAGQGLSTYDRYTYYRLLSQMGVDSAPEQDQINLNYSNAAAYFYPDGVLSNIVFYPNAETNLTPWNPVQFFTIAADKMLRMYSQEWIKESPSNYVAVYGITTNISTAPDPVLNPTNIPIPFGISDIPVVISNRFVYTPAIQRVLQLAANIYDATTNNTFFMGTNFPSVFRPIFRLTPVLAPTGIPAYTNVYIAGYEPVGDYYVNGQLELGTVNPTFFNAGTDPQFYLPVNVAGLLNPANQILRYGYSGNFGSGIYTNVNVYGVPWIIGAKKGFPNFNEFAMESAFQLTRKLQVTRDNTNDTYINNPDAYHYNQMFNLSLSNQFGVECWNSYTNNYLRSVAIYVTGTNMCLLTNDENFSANLNSGLSGYITINNTSNNYNGWPGYNPNGNNTAVFWTSESFQLPLDTNVTIITNSAYRFNVGPNYEESGHGSRPYLTTNLYLPFETNVLVNGSSIPQPHWWLMSTNDIRVIILDTQTTPYHIIDYVQLSGPNSTRDLTSEIIRQYDTVAGPDGKDMWNTNVQSGQVEPIGIVSQLGVCEGNYTDPDPAWEVGDTEKQNEINAFLAFLGYNGLPLTEAVAAAQMTNAMQAPYTPTATVVQHFSWQANDPLVHYLASDLNSANGNLLDRTVDDLTNENLGQVNQRYMPWGNLSNTNVSGFMTENAYDLAIKDPLVWQSDDWDFPRYKLPTIGWLGRVHRGTPWQTVYLKSPDILREIQMNAGVTNYAGTNTWVQWSGDSLLASGQYYDAVNTAPVQDRLLFDLFTTAPDDNATRGQLSVNVGASDPANSQAGLAAWSALFSGVEVLSNTVPDGTVASLEQHNGSLTNFTAFPINPAGPAGANSPVGRIVTGINQTRANANKVMMVVFSGHSGTYEIPATFTNLDSLNGAFEHVGDILAVPQLSVASPFLNTAGVQPQYGISDEMYDWLPQQVMSLLRVSGTAHSPMRYVIYSYGQALKPAPSGIYTGGGPYFGMVTNYQVVAESATRAVVNFGSVVTNTVITRIITDGGNSFTNWINVPAVTNNTVQIKQYNVLPPN